MICPNCEAFIVDSTKECWNCKTKSTSNHIETAQVPSDSQNESEKIKFYQTNAFVIIMLLSFTVIGIFLMWKYNKFSLHNRILISILFLLSVIYNFNYISKAYF